jgi:hypothetical protein
MAPVIRLQNGRLPPVERRLFAHASMLRCGIRNREIILSEFVAGPAFLKRPVIAPINTRCVAIQYRAKLLIGKTNLNLVEVQTQ